MDYSDVKIPISFDAGDGEEWIDDLEHTFVSWRTSVPAIGTKVQIVRTDYTSRTWRVADVIHETRFTERSGTLDAYQITRVMLDRIPDP